MSLSTFRINQPPGSAYPNWDRARRDILLYGLPVADRVELEAQNPAETSYKWEIISMPQGATVVISGSTANKCDFEINYRGAYLARLTVNEGLPSESITVLYFSVVTEGGAHSLPALNETNEDNSESPYTGVRGTESKLNSFSNSVDRHIWSPLKLEAFSRAILASESGYTFASNAPITLTLPPYGSNLLFVFETELNDITINCQGADTFYGDMVSYYGTTWTSIVLKGGRSKVYVKGMAPGRGAGWRLYVESGSLYKAGSISKEWFGGLSKDELEVDISMVPEGVTKASHQQMLTTGLWDTPWGLTSDIKNVINGGATKAYRDVKVFFNSDNEPRLLVLDATNNKIEVWNPRTFVLESTSGNLSDNLPSGSGQTWLNYSMCTDGEYVYVMFLDSSLVPNYTHQVQAWKISDWTVHPGWPATGTTLPGTGPTYNNYSRTGTIIIANATKLATINNWNIITAVSSAAISIINKATGVIDASGAGDAPIAVLAQGIAGICSDGTNIFFHVYGVGPLSGYTCSATIANPQVGCGGLGYPYLLGVQKVIGRLCQCGAKLIISVTAQDPTAPVVSTAVLYTHSALTAYLDSLVIGQNSYSTPLSGTDFCLEKVCDVCFDGINIWILGMITPTGGDMAVLIKIDVAKLVAYTLASPSSRQLPDVVSGIFFIPPDALPSNIYMRSFSQVCFDGRDIWVNPEPRASQPLSGKLYRLPFALLRG